jgi:biopolymer transport protein TolR
MSMHLSKGGHGRGYRKQQFSEINVTPMVDVMLVLLVIFMVTAPMMTTAVTVDLPETSSSPVQGDDEPLEVSVKKDGTVYIQKTEVKIEDVAAKLEAIAGQKKETRIFVRGDKSVDYGMMMEVVGAINGAGFLKVGLVTDSAAVASSKAKK